MRMKRIGDKENKIKFLDLWKFFINMNFNQVESGGIRNEITKELRRQI